MSIVKCPSLSAIFPTTLLRSLRGLICQLVREYSPLLSKKLWSKHDTWNQVTRGCIKVTSDSSFETRSLENWPVITKIFLAVGLILNVHITLHAHINCCSDSTNEGRNVFLGALIVFCHVRWEFSKVWSEIFWKYNCRIYTNHMRL